MKRAHNHPEFGRSVAFTLIEMIGVLAIMAILASVLVPNVLRSMDRAAIRAEAETLKALGEQTKQYLRANGTAPTAANWTTTIGTFADIAPIDIATNKRAMARVYLLEPTIAPATAQRAMILSSMRIGLALPTATNIATAAQFQRLWQTADNAVPSSASWGGWNAWTAVANSGEYLLIERINLQPTDDAALLAEAEILTALGEQTKLYRSSKGMLPGAGGANWYDDLGMYSNVAPAEIAKNKRGITRSWIVDRWSTPAQLRVMILSSMSARLPTPTASTLTQFDTIWGNTGFDRHLLIERINLQPTDDAELLAEAEILTALGEQTKLYRSSKGMLPGAGGTNWYDDLGAYSDLSPAEIAKNRRGITRSWIVDRWSTPPLQRVMILSSMGVSLPTGTFDTIWNTTGYDRHLLIERVNLRQTTVTITFNTTEATAVGRYSFRVPGATVDSGPFAIVPSRTFAPGTILTLYSNEASNYTYAVGTVARTFDLIGTNWTPQP
jgi:type II secretory pathway pseudopilin PulG